MANNVRNIACVITEFTKKYICITTLFDEMVLIFSGLLKMKNHIKKSKM